MHSIKITVFVCVIFLVSEAKELPKEIKDMVMMMTEDCRKNNGLPDAEMTKILEGKLSETKPAKCTLTCLLKQFHMAKTNDRFLEVDCEAANSMAAMSGTDKTKLDKGKEICDICKAPREADECEFSGTFVKCVLKEATARGIKLNDM
ncbi:uncharacterized protein LOC116348376 [Contarinia nasturtii]|uniref:uncharacterized protein LOC116348376 n=1 Tax=Contarinia nasturtii TaxID=265458 RepID=UPI0012D4A969|nr:uncharacterized protein LOC116348376 [Contarinia nasturtii]